MEQARKILDRDHYGLEKVKERILEFIAVRQLNPQAKGKILCLVGPPGVGKTSIALSVAKAMHRKLSRLSLGGVRDEADIRGHRKTYIGAMPGRIIDAVIRSGSMNPLLVLDEIDKLASDMRGDPASALLEVLDSEQNHAFRDHFLEVPVDLSRVMFITTANTLDTIPRPLLDRMEVIELSSYTDEEKLQIAKQHLLPKQLKEHGLKKAQLRISDDAIRRVIAAYTRESGVRVLERQLGKLCRKAAMQLVDGDVKRVDITDKNLRDLLGVEQYTDSVHSDRDQVGVVNGLAWTQVGGEILEVEAQALDGSGKLELTGNLGTVMQESAKAAEELAFLYEGHIGTALKSWNDPTAKAALGMAKTLCGYAAQGDTYRALALLTKYERDKDGFAALLWTLDQLCSAVLRRPAYGQEQCGGLTPAGAAKILNADARARKSLTGNGNLRLNVAVLAGEIA